ncbi:hypothetical protein FHQ18_08550 [Deferribacter autotrophicus]|uniref:Uncharacterized protein n=1 Tax=Deferribacter autotrophicus TaxID=500465 RepID=A0A5A8F550_9BACT|nr:hypothetical protein [Deferribacter autotrophicus]KAA0257782.1 hypothetical protein FHQ18_08550 [Deferribacter autotrophicus]
MFKKVLMFLVVVFVSLNFALDLQAKEVTDIAGMLDKAKNLGVMDKEGGFMVCLLNKNDEYLVKFKVSSDGEYLIMTKNSGVDFEGQLLTRNYSYQLVVECTDFNLPDQKRFFNCNEDMDKS